MSKFAARGGTFGANNPRKTFGAELADPYASSDENVRPHVDAALRVVCKVSNLLILLTWAFSSKKIHLL